MTTQDRDRVLLKMLKTPPKHHKADKDRDELAKMIDANSLDIEKMAKLMGQADTIKNFGKKSTK